MRPPGGPGTVGAMSEPYSETYQPIDPELDPLADPDLRQADSSIPQEDDEDGGDLRDLQTDTLLSDSDDDTYDATRRVSRATEELMRDDVDPNNETIEERLQQEEPDESGGSGHVGGDHVAAADTEDPERV